MLTVKFAPGPWRRYMLECAALDRVSTVSCRGFHAELLLRGRQDDRFSRRRAEPGSLSRGSGFPTSWRVSSWVWWPCHWRWPS